MPLEVDVNRNHRTGQVAARKYCIRRAKGSADSSLLLAGVVILASMGTTLLGLRSTSAPSLAARALAGFDPVRTAYVVTGGAGGDLPGCGAISAIDVETGEVRYSSPRLGSRKGLSASEDLSVFASGGGSGNSNVYLMDARDEALAAWAARELNSPRGPSRLIGSATAILDNALWFSVSGGVEAGKGVGRVQLPWLGDDPDRRDVNPLDAFYSLRNENPAQILPDPNGRSVYVLSHSYRLPDTVDEVVEAYDYRLHVLDRRSFTAHEAAITLPSLVVDEPPGAGLKEKGVHNWLQNGRLAYMTLLTTGPEAHGPQPLWAVVNRWNRPELAFASLTVKAGARSEVVTATLPADFAFAGAIAASQGPNNLGLVAVHGGDKVAVFDVDPFAGDLHELARIEITPVVSPIIDDRRMMSGPIAWSADGSHLIVAGNEAAAEVLILAVEGCGEGLSVRLRHQITACPYDAYNGLAGIVTAQGSAVAPKSSAPRACPVPWWAGEPWEFGTGYILSLPWMTN